MTDTTERLRELAAKATPRPWEPVTYDPRMVRTSAFHQFVCDAEDNATAAYIVALANTALPIIDHLTAALAEANARADRAEAALREADVMREGIRQAGVKRNTLYLYQAVMAYDAARAALEPKP